MGVKLQILQDGETRTVEVPGRSAVVINNNTTAPVLVNNTQAPAKVIEVLKGRPGVQNVFHGPTPPPNPQEGWIWIDTA